LLYLQGFGLEVLELGEGQFELPRDLPVPGLWGGQVLGRTSRCNSDFNFARLHVLACVIAVLKYLVEPPGQMILGRMFR